MQNDLQAMARCHRIGQDKDVTVYRLITDATYEQDVFACSTRKQGTSWRFCQGVHPCFQWALCFCKRPAWWSQLEVLAPWQYTVMPA